MSGWIYLGNLEFDKMYNTLSSHVDGIYEMSAIFGHDRLWSHCDYVVKGIEEKFRHTLTPIAHLYRYLSRLHSDCRWRGTEICAFQLSFEIWIFLLQDISNEEVFVVLQYVFHT